MGKKYREYEAVFHMGSDEGVAVHLALIFNHIPTEVSAENEHVKISALFEDENSDLCNMFINAGGRYKGTIELPY